MTGSFSKHFLALSLLVAATRGAATDGVIEINQPRALAGGVTAGDAPGFPVTIDASGSYRLTGNLELAVAPTPENTVGIDIVVADVTLDLNGFAVIGTTVCSGTPRSCSPKGSGDGIRTVSTAVIHGGTVRGAGNDGINVGPYSRIEGMQVTDCGANGITAVRSIVRGNTVFRNGANGLYSADGGNVIRNNHVEENIEEGIRPGSANVIVANTSDGNGTHGILVRENNVVSENSAHANLFSGITCFGACEGNNVQGNSAGYNGADGLGFSDGNLLLTNIATSNAIWGVNIGASGWGRNASTANGMGAKPPGGIILGANLCDGSTTCP